MDNACKLFPHLIYFLFFFPHSLLLFFFLLWHRAVKWCTHTNSQCKAAFIFQRSNPQSPLSPLFGESAPKAKISQSIYQAAQVVIIFMHTAMISSSLKFMPYITIKDMIPLKGKTHGKVCTLPTFLWIFEYIYICVCVFLSPFWEMQWCEGIKMQNKPELGVKYSNGGLFTKDEEFLSHWHHMFALIITKRPNQETSTTDKWSLYAKRALTKGCCIKICSK